MEMDQLLYILQHTRFKKLRRPDVILGNERIDGMTKWRRRDLKPNGRVVNNLDFDVLNAMTPYDGMVFGIKRCRRKKRWVPCRNNRQFNNLFVYLDSLITQELPGFNYTAVHVAKNLQSKPHNDKHNIRAYFLELGNHLGGGLDTAHGRITVRSEFVEFDSTEQHSTPPFSGGDRYSIIVYQTTGAPDVNVMNLLPKTYKFIQPFQTGACPYYQNKYLTFALCKPRVRALVLPGDLIVSCSPRNNKILFVGEVATIVHFREYEQWCISHDRVPLHSAANPFSDCLFRKTSMGFKRVASPLEHLGVAKQLIETPIVVVMKQFAYYGADGPVCVLKAARRGFNTYDYQHEFHRGLLGASMVSQIVVTGDALLPADWDAVYDTLPTTSHTDRFDFFNELGMRVYIFKVKNTNIVFKPDTTYYDKIQRDAGLIPVPLTLVSIEDKTKFTCSVMLSMTKDPYRSPLGVFCGSWRFTSTENISLETTGPSVLLVTSDFVSL